MINWKYLISRIGYILFIVILSVIDLMALPDKGVDGLKSTIVGVVSSWNNYTARTLCVLHEYHGQNTIQP